MIARSIPLAGIGLLLLLAFGLESGRRPAPLRQRAYIWQRDWTPAVSAAVRQAGPHLDGFLVLGAEVAWKDGTPHVLRPRVDWVALRETGQPLGIALRIGPFDPFDLMAREESTQLLAELAKSLVAEARENGVPCAEFQVDYDCADRKLAAYRSWLPALRAAVKPVRFVITTLPAWLDDEAEMTRLVAGVDGFVLQVHSVPTRDSGERAALFDTARARRWVGRAAKLGRPFTVSLPTYSALVGYDSHGRSLGMALDGVQPSWPAGTRVVEFVSDSAELSRLVAEWRTARPAGMEGVAWYRLPVGSGERTWRWPTFAAVMEGREPAHRLQVFTAGGNPVDLSLANAGEAEESLHVAVLVRWDGPAATAAEALRGWTVFQSEHEARFTRDETAVPRLLPGGCRNIGWLRFNQPTQTYAEILR
jgi:Protein of unknown function (DUF3142)